MNAASTLVAKPVDQVTTALFVYVPPQNVILFQAFIELYEGLAAVRTVDREASIVCLMVCNDMLSDLYPLLDALRPELEWRHAAEPSGTDWQPL